MDWIAILSFSVLFLVSFIIGFLLRNFLPSYFTEKGKNLATKEDVENITRKTEEVQKEFRENLERFTTDLRFKNDFYYRQYAELYSKLYGIIIQSEYVRRFISLEKGKEISFEEAPFLEVSPTRRFTQKIQFSEGKQVTATQEEETVETPISCFNKKQLCEYIIQNAEYATQDLLKLAISYRYAYHYYSGNQEVKNASCQKVADDEEFRLIRCMVCRIVQEYNYFREKLKMDYDRDELSTGIPKVM